MGAISDAAFDKLERRAIKLEHAYPELAMRYPSRSDRVGAWPLPNTTSETSASAVESRDREGAPKAPLSVSGSNGAGNNGGKGGGGVPSAADPHLAPMLSLDNALTEADLKAWLERLSRRLMSQSALSSSANMIGESSDFGSSETSGNAGSEFGGMSVRLLSEPKIDGLSLSLRWVRITPFL